MGIRDLVPWTKSQQLSTGREAFDPFLTLHREMNRLFDDVFRGFGPLGRFGSPLLEGEFGWPRLEVSETDKAVSVAAELPGLTEKDVQVEIANGILSIRGEKKPSGATIPSWSASVITAHSSGRFRSTASRKTRPKRNSRMAS